MTFVTDMIFKNQYLRNYSPDIKPMKKGLLFLLIFVAFFGTTFSQSTFDYSLELSPINIADLPGLHSYAFAQTDDKWLVIGGRKDGIHARQPFNAFPESQNNTDIYVIDVVTQEFWSASVSALPSALSEQLQATNINFHQDEDTLYLIGGYAYSPTAGDHITFPNLISVQVPSLIEAIINENPIDSYFKQITNDNFALTGGHLGKIENTFYLIGGHRFDGRYNPMDHPTFIQTYSNQIRKFTIDNSGTQLSVDNYSAITDPVHLRRRDYNLLPQIFPDGTEGFTISSGVFQMNVDLPFLYPVDITADGYNPITTFNQYLSNYHSATACLYDSIANEMHAVFFGGISQYYYQNGNLIQDDQVPFVNTISRLTRFEDGTLQEFQLPVEMPALKGASAEFIPNPNLPLYTSGIIKLSQMSQDTITIGHILGGIISPSLNPFNVNQTSTTSADNTIYAVKLIKNTPTGIQEINGNNPYDIQIFPNPAKNQFNLTYDLEQLTDVNYFITASNGQLLEQGQIDDQKIGKNKLSITLLDSIPPQALFITFVFEHKYFVTKTIIKE